jgi:Ca-activated chloride channel homolog
MTSSICPTTHSRRAVFFVRQLRLAAVFLCLCGFLMPTSASAQMPDDVHILPRAKPQRAGTVAPLRVSVDLVTVPVTVTDEKNHPVLDLSKDDFRLFEDQNEQKIQYFFSEDAPLSVGVLVDLSSSMGNKIDSVRQAVSEFFSNANPADDYFVITFADKPKLLADTTQSVETIQAKLGAATAKGNTALADAIFMGVRKLRSAKYERKALLIISDGGDNRSRYTEGELRRVVRESDVQIYSIGIFDAYAPTSEEQMGPDLLKEICEMTGGRLFNVGADLNDLQDIASRISAELRNQYVIGYTPSDVRHDGNWRKLRVKLVPPPGLPQLTVHFRQGYYAPSE